MVVLVCGGRDYSDVNHLTLFLDTQNIATPITTLIAGGARGADTLAEHWARSRGIQTAIYTAQWERYGRSAGPRRNSDMLRDGKPNLVIAFPGGAGTENMIRQSLEAGVRVIRA